MCKKSHMALTLFSPHTGRAVSTSHLKMERWKEHIATAPNPFSLPGTSHASEFGPIKTHSPLPPLLIEDIWTLLAVENVCRLGNLDFLPLSSLYPYLTLCANTHKELPCPHSHMPLTITSNWQVCSSPCKSYCFHTSELTQSVNKKKVEHQWWTATFIQCTFTGFYTFRKRLSFLCLSVWPYLIDLFLLNTCCTYTGRRNLNRTLR